MFLIALFPAVALGFYLPGLSSKDFKKNDSVPLFANSLRSSVTELPYAFYHKNLHFPAPSEMVDEPEGLGSVLKGDRLVSTKFDIRMLVDSECSFLGTAEIPKQETPFLYDKIMDDYYFSWELDDLPAVLTQDPPQNETATSIPMGSYTKVPPRAVVNTLFEIVVHYHQESQRRLEEVDGIPVATKEPDSKVPTYRVIKFEVKPLPLDLVPPKDPKAVKAIDCQSSSEKEVKRLEEAKIHYYYTVKFKQTDLQWVHRWDEILTAGKSKIHWYNIAHSLVIVIFLIFMVLTILLRALHRDISRYNQLEANEEAHEEFGWKLIHGDVFRTPPRYMALSVMLGNGAQLFFMSCATLFLACFGFLSPSRRGSLLTALIVTYFLSGFVAGYVSALFYKMFGGEAWKKNVLLTVFVAPGGLVLVFIILNFILVGVGSSAAVPFTTMLAVFALWFLISVPLCFVGAFRAFKGARIEYPVKTNQIPRQIPSHVWYMRQVPACLMGGILPFGAIFVELYYIIRSIWSQHFYYVFGFLFIIGTILVLTCATVSILLVYFQLCEEDYRWWWRAFFSSGSSGVYVFFNSIIYYAKQKTSTKASTFFIYFGWTFVMSVMFTFVTGFIGFVSCFLFMRKIYGSIKID